MAANFEEPRAEQTVEIIQEESKRRWRLKALFRFIPRQWRDEWATVLTVQLLVVTVLLRLFWLAQPEGALVFDEAYYVNAARVILGWPVPEGMAYHDYRPGIDPNQEHLPLAKVMIAGSMRLFGDNAFGWRIPSVIFGTLAVAALYLLVRRLTRRPWMAFLAAFIFSFDNLVFVHGRIATLDIFMLAFMLAAMYFYARRRPELAGAALALSTLSKFNGIFGLVALLAFEGLRFALRPDRRQRVWRSLADGLLLVGTFVTVFLAVLWVLDTFWTTYQNPIDHVAHVYNYGMSLKRDTGPQGIESTPWQWLLNEVEIPYYKSEATVSVDGNVVSSKPLVSFKGEMNPFIIFMLPLAVGYLLHAAWRKRDDLPLMMLALMVATYLPSLAAAVLVHRISYIFYFLPVVAPLAISIAYLLTDLKLPRTVIVAYAIGVLAGFAALFPFRTIL